MEPEPLAAFRHPGVYARNGCARWEQPSMQQVLYGRGAVEGRVTSFSVRGGIWSFQITAPDALVFCFCAAGPMRSKVLLLGQLVRIRGYWSAASAGYLAAEEIESLEA